MGCVQSLFQEDADLETLYSLDKCIGEGVEGMVYLATCKASGAKVAIKLVPRGPELGLGPEKVRREIQLQARLSHVNIVELKQVILTRKHLGIVMTYEAGGDLHMYVTKYKLDETVARYFFRQIVEGLGYCHRCHIAHRDLKLANFLLSTDEPMRVKLCDFGCARKWETKEVPAQRVGRFKTFAGTPAYMSPQVLQSAFYPTNTYDAIEADVWALGIVLCHLFFGAHTPFWLTPNAFRNEGMTMQARIEAMKQQNWVDSDEFVKANATNLSPECRDLLDKIFVADEFKRITLQGIKEHPWYTAELPPFLQQALDDLKLEQDMRDRMLRATVSLAANRHDTAAPDTGEFATIDLLVDLAQKHRKMPGGGLDKVFCLDMAHMDLNKVAMSPPGSPLAAAAAAVRAADAGADISIGSARHKAGSAGGDASLRNGSAAAGSGSATPVFAGLGDGSIDEDDTLEGTQHSTVSGASCSSSLARAASAGDRSTHLTSIAGAPDVQSTGRFYKTLSLKESKNGMLIGQYVLQPADGPSSPLSGTASVPAGNSLLGRSSSNSWFGSLGVGAAAQQARSVHAGNQFFNAAGERSIRGGRVAAAAAAAALAANKTVHGGTAHAATKEATAGGIFYEG
ncbi:hypothetical protein OEZ85_001641 [Tetradesmus obliquus]|uniref:Protein kinase domain-containing protein n=1 Tax=Tetradesmus obliquus TaxID=3088 RepID=A0ABY8U5J0_TETOB|nr:hypothetical protein OEZ85_001641 [Tetradesmus obliquus]